MARPSLFTHRKFVRLSRILGAMYKAAGVLEVLWHHAYQDGEPRLGPAEDVEYMIEWDGEPGACASALVESGFLDLDDDGGLVVHDLGDHAPDYVLGRYQKEASRRGITLSRDDVREILRGNLVLGQSKDSPGTVSGQSEDSLSTPAPAPAPAPIEEKTTSSSSSRGDDSAFVNRVIDFWTSKGLKPTVRAVSPQRRSSILARQREHGGKMVMAALKNRAESKFLCFEIFHGRGAPIDWLFGPKNFVKVADGNYNDEGGSGPPQEGKKSVYDSVL